MASFGSLTGDLDALTNDGQPVDSLATWPAFAERVR